jgi:serine/threonine protein kinase
MTSEFARVQDESSKDGVTPIADMLGPGARYELRRLLGRGGMGEVYEAVHRTLRSRVVIKLIRADRADNPAIVQRLRLEAQALARLTHPNLVRVTDFDVTAAGQPFFVMEFLDGSSLGDRRKQQGRFQIAAAIDIVIQALEGLAAAHDAGLVHRDIKPDNIFLAHSQ